MSPVEQLLREQIAELTKLLQLKDERIKELEALRTIPGVLWTPPIQVTCTTDANVQGEKL